MAVARSCNGVAVTPAPACIMTGLAPGELQFNVRAWTKDFGDWIEVRTELTMKIRDGLAEAGIEVPRPQREVVLRTLPPEPAPFAPHGRRRRRQQPEERGGEPAGATALNGRARRALGQASARQRAFSPLACAKRTAHRIGPRDRRHCAESFGGQRRSHRGIAPGVQQAVAGQPARNEGAAEGVAGAGGIDAAAGVRGDAVALSGVGQQRPGSAQLQRHGARAKTQAMVGDGVRLGQAGQRLQILQAGQTDVAACDQVG